MTTIKRSFTDTVAALRYESLAAELDTALQSLVLKCQDTGRSGELVLKLKVKPSKTGPFEIIDDIKLNMPKEDKGTSLMWPTPEGHLQSNDPRQNELPGLAVVDKGTLQIRAVAK